MEMIKVAMKTMTIKLLLLLILCLPVACATFDQALEMRPPVTFEEVIRLTHEKVPAEMIIRKIRDSGTVFRLNSDEVAELKQQGVDSEVIDYMMNTYVEQVRRDQAMEDWNRWWYYGDHYYWWPNWDTYYYPRIYRHHDRDRDHDHEKKH